jgi:hypothetical protein
MEEDAGAASAGSQFKHGTTMSQQLEVNQNHQRADS